MPTGGHALVEPSPLQRLLPYQHCSKLPCRGGACILRTQSSGDLMARAIILRHGGEASNLNPGDRTAPNFPQRRPGGIRLLAWQLH